jgi:uncharacterized UPF0160 family protein
MSARVATHSGQFHADDVTAWAMIRVFHDGEATLVRTRDPAILDASDLVIDVGGRFDPAAGRFDHHQASYTGALSSAGMILAWLEETGQIAADLAATLRVEGVDYVDDVDNGRRAPDPSVPCIASMVDAFNQPHETPDAQLTAFLAAGEVVVAWIRGVQARMRKVAEATATVCAEMDRAAAEGRNTLIFEQYVSWKEPYFKAGGAGHPTEYVLFPGPDDTWRILAIPPKLGDFGQKRSLPEAWAGLTDDELSRVSGIPGAKFCHKNLFIAVFDSRAGAEAALRTTGRWSR